MNAPSTITPPKKRFFHSLNAFRFFAALNVFAHHLPISDVAWERYLKFGGGTFFFFLLSGFLITYWIYEEKQQTGKFNFRNFHARRILRVWPLFYLLVGLCYLVPAALKYAGMEMTVNGYEPNPWISFLFLENYQMILTHSAPDFSALGTTWAICVQEHFYIIWSLILLVLPLKHLPKALAVLVAISIGVRIAFVRHGYDPTEIVTSFDSFAYGIVVAYLLLTYGTRLEERISRIPRNIQMLYIFVFLGILLVYGFGIGRVAKPIVCGVLFSILLLLSLPKNAYIKIPEKNIFSRLGIYAYGIFAYHTFIIVLGYKICTRYSISLTEALPAACFGITTFVLTVACAAASYHLLERPFLKLKKYFR